MNRNEETIARFYSAFQKLDYVTMKGCYDENVIFYDPVFEDLVDNEVGYMWEMLCERATDLSIVFSHVHADEEFGTCNWVATYTFTRTKRKVVNPIKAHMRFREGKIIEHSDQFSLRRWCSQALGWRGFLLGGTSWLQGKVKRSAQKNLYDYIVAKQAKIQST